MASRLVTFLVLSLALLASACSSDKVGNRSDGGPESDAMTSGPADAGAQPETCNFTNCEGCCDGNTCVTTVGEAACGTSGSACQQCTGSNICAAGTCVPPNDCADCDGCCLDGTQCLEGNTQAACGALGDVCLTCPAGQRCNGIGDCEDVVCDATNCNGCCTANGECISNDEQSVFICGLPGEACGVCSFETIECVMGVCVEDQPCLDFCTNGCCTEQGQCIPFSDQDPTTCGSATQCSACTNELSCLGGACIADPVWTITINSAIIDPTDAEGGDWDQTVFTNPLPDPYVAGSLAGDTFIDWVTATIDNTVTPNWDETVDSYLQSDLVGTGMQFNLRDSDGGGLFEIIGSCTVSISLNDLLAGTKTVAICGRATDLVIDFAPQ